MKNTTLFILTINLLFAFYQSSGQTKKQILLKCGTQNQRAMELFNTANWGLQTNRLDGAKRLYQKALTIDSTFCDAWDNLSVCCRRLGDYEGAYWGGIRSIMIDSTNPTGWINCGYALFLEGDMSNALKSFGHLQRIIPENPEGYYGQSLVFYSIDSISQAYKNINRAIENYQIGRIKITPEIKMLEGFIAYQKG